MRVCLVYPHPGEPSGLNIPHGLLQLAAELRAAGHQTRIVDYNSTATGIPYGDLREFDAVGLSVTTPQLRQALEIAAALKDSQLVVWGGVHAFLDPASILNRFPRHYVIRGEGELPLVELLEVVSRHGRSPARLRKVPGLCFHDGAPIVADPYFNPALDELHDVDYHDLEHLEEYLHRDIYYCTGKVWCLDILTSRGCHWDCSFCINALVAAQGGKYRSKSIAKLRRETEPIVDQFGIRFVSPIDEDFFLNQPLVDGWMAYAREKGFFWNTNCRYNYFNGKLMRPERLAEYLESGLFQIGMSIEAGDETIRNTVISKSVRDADIDRAVARIREVAGPRLQVNTSFIIGFPGDTRDSRVKMLRLMDRLSRSINVTFSGPQVYRPYPGSRLTDVAPGHEPGNLDSYLERMADSSDASGMAVGAPRELLDGESYFYTHVARVFFNQRFQFFRHAPGDGRGRLELAGAGARAYGARRAMIWVIQLLFLPILARLKLGWFGGFFEPRLVGGLARAVDRLLAVARRGSKSGASVGRDRT